MSQKDYLPLEEYPVVIRDITTQLTEARKQLRAVQGEIKYKKAYTIKIKITKADGSSDLIRNAAASLKLLEDKDYVNLCNMEDLLTTQISNLEGEYNYRKDQFLVLRLQIQERTRATDAICGNG